MIEVIIQQLRMQALTPSIRGSKQNVGGLFVSLFLVGTANAEAGLYSVPPSIKTAPLSVNQVVDNLFRKDEERAKALRHYQSTRIYRLSYHGFPGDRGAQMTVEATYDRPATKNFKVISQSGSKLIIDRVFKRLLDSEKEAAEPEMRAKTLMNRNNYNIALTGYEPSGTGIQYVLTVDPKKNSKYVYR